jgi:hypothetical protein
MPFKTPNYSFERSQRERAQQAKAQKKSDLRAEKAAKRKETRGEDEPEKATDPAGQPNLEKQ